MSKIVGQDTVKLALLLAAGEHIVFCILCSVYPYDCHARRGQRITSRLFANHFSVDHSILNWVSACF